MRNLFAFIWKYHFFLLFLLLEVVSFSLIINSSVYQRYVLLNSSNKITGTIYNTYANVTDFIKLKRANQTLALENAKLREALQHPKSQKDILVPNKDSLKFNPQYQYIEAKVINNTVTQRNNYLMLNKGRLHGVDKDMAVIASDGIVGIVINASTNFSWVMSMLNENTKINGKLLKNNFQGSVTWSGGNYRMGKLSDLPAHIELQQGDTVVTSGYSLMFPEGILIGTIEDFNVDKGDHFFTCKVRFSVDFNNLSYVYVIKNVMRREQLSIQKFL